MARVAEGEEEKRKKKKGLHSREGMDLGSRGGLVDNNILAASEAL